MNEKLDALVEELLEREYWVIDILPRQVSAGRGEAYFAAESFFLEEERLRALYGRFASVVIKLSCYFDLALYMDGIWTQAPAPRELLARIAACADGGFCNVLLPGEKALITLYGGDLYMTLFNPAEELLETLRQLSSAEGLFMRPGE